MLEPNELPVVLLVVPLPKREFWVPEFPPKGEADAPPAGVAPTFPNKLGPVDPAFEVFVFEPKGLLAPPADPKRFLLAPELLLPNMVMCCRRRGTRASSGKSGRKETTSGWSGGPIGRNHKIEYDNAIVLIQWKLSPARR